AVGRLLKGLAELGQAEDTIVIFLSDNGPSYLGLTEEEARVRNPLGLKGGKATVWENGIRVPLVVRWPHRIKPGERPQFGAVEDILPTLVELTGLDTAKFPRHLPWHGISLRDALENPDAPQAERAVFRVGIAGEGAVGGKRAFVSDPAKLPMSEQHVVLRGPRYKFHQFAGGKTALFDVVADPAEADDMSSRFPDITRRYADELRRQYRQIAESGRALRMPVVLVGEPGPGRNRLDGVMAQRATGNVHGAGASAIRGFTSPTDAVEYAIEVTKAGRYDVTVTGKNLDSVRRWLLEIADLAVAPKTAAAEQLEFGPVAVAAGPATVRLSAQEHACGSQTHAVIARISFRLRSEQDRGILPVR
ncbi:MAG: sulfatase-like hydrolase/transferase, partial [Verrucomicrobiae bacterium]|nr:sulfatase-like hydrolase/transferase [Verrucomicrobiae bacterium]